MNVLMGILGAIVVALLAFIILLAITTPSCEDLGGKSELVYFMPVWQGAPPNQWLQMVPIYDCKGAKQ